MIMKLELMEKKNGCGEKNTYLILTAKEGNVGITIGSRMQAESTKVLITPFEARSLAIHLLELANEAERQVRVDLLSKAPVGATVKLVAVGGWKEKRDQDELNEFTQKVKRDGRRRGIKMS